MLYMVKNLRSKPERLMKRWDGNLKGYCENDNLLRTIMDDFFKVICYPSFIVNTSVCVECSPWLFCFKIISKPSIVIDINKYHVNII